MYTWMVCVICRSWPIAISDFSQTSILGNSVNILTDYADKTVLWKSTSGMSRSLPIMIDISDMEGKYSSHIFIMNRGIWNPHGNFSEVNAHFSCTSTKCNSTLLAFINEQNIISSKFVITMQIINCDGDWKCMR